jgi:hypothetical protein
MAHATNNNTRVRMTPPAATSIMVRSLLRTKKSARDIGEARKRL